MYSSKFFAYLMVIWAFKGRDIFMDMCTDTTFETEEFVEILTGAGKIRFGILGLIYVRNNIFWRKFEWRFEILQKVLVSNSPSSTDPFPRSE